MQHQSWSEGLFQADISIAHDYMESHLPQWEGTAVVGSLPCCLMKVNIQLSPNSSSKLGRSLGHAGTHQLCNRGRKSHCSEINLRFTFEISTARGIIFCKRYLYARCFFWCRSTLLVEWISFQGAGKKRDIVQGTTHGFSFYIYAEAIFR